MNEHLPRSPRDGDAATPCRLKCKTTLYAIPQVPGRHYSGKMLVFRTSDTSLTWAVARPACMHNRLVSHKDDIFTSIRAMDSAECCAASYHWGNSGTSLHMTKLPEGRRSGQRDNGAERLQFSVSTLQVLLGDIPNANAAEECAIFLCAQVVAVFLTLQFGWGSAMCALFNVPGAHQRARSTMIILELLRSARPFSLPVEHSRRTREFDYVRLLQSCS